MSGLSNLVMWKQPWNSDAESTFRQALAQVGASIQELPSQQWNSSSSTIGGIRDYLVSYLAPASNTWSSVNLHLNSNLAESLSAELSRLAASPAIIVREYDETAWGYCIFEAGVLRNCFWNIPWVVEVLPESCAGDVDLVSSLFGVPANSVAPYLMQFPDNGPEGKAFDNDQFALNNPWVRIDFMRRLGLAYPEPGRAPFGRYVLIKESNRTPLNIANAHER